MSITRGLLVLCGLGLSAPALAQQADLAFEYSPVARLLQNGQFRAEVWRRDIATDRIENAWNDAEPALTAAVAITAACASIKQNFDPSFRCSRAATPAPYEGATVKGPSPPAQRKPPIVRTSAYPSRVTSPNPAPQSGGSAWIKNFWEVRDREGGGGGGSGGDSGGGGGMP